MVFEIPKRYLYGLIVLAFNLLCVIAIIISKVVFLKKLQKKNLVYTNQEEFKDDVKFYQAFGFDLVCKASGTIVPCDQAKKVKN